ncbi:hypothetical protein ASPWEDRAFT_35481 [Aspergillus wentii DTO 134E9]|uniref:Uncharacterized protein n=1 Tax=Aspergillus wentii DTO 134E9 TaxID=1073089 RepID=A0A1L9S3Z6_ASPWE|nr:uncharacterized protein ASPWEDRAFT_35481 [Aspergillus wentii DTO 134E9]OJJ41864.1 hypothetical protein ASPWEDRAFT_35481 [Aspergillus wentii DTO 134E9]
MPLNGSPPMHGDGGDPRRLSNAPSDSILAMIFILTASWDQKLGIFPWTNQSQKPAEHNVTFDFLLWSNRNIKNEPTRGRTIRSVLLAHRMMVYICAVRTSRTYRRALRLMVSKGPSPSSPRSDSAQLRSSQAPLAVADLSRSRAFAEDPQAQ